MRLACAAAIALAGCGAAPPPAPEVPGPPAPAPPAWAIEDDALAARLREVLARLGPERVAPLDLSAFLAARSQRPLALEIPRGECWTIVAVASSGMRDLDARLYTPDGELVAEDAASDPRPVLQVCAGEAARSLWLVLDAYDGAGSVRVGAASSSRDALAAIRRELGAPGSVAEAHAGLPRSELDEALARRGLPLAEPVAVPLDAGQAIRVPLRARGGHCQAVVARAREPALRIAMRALDLAGTPLTIGEGDGREVALQRCEDADVERAIELTAIEGAGAVDLAIGEAPAGVVGGAPALWIGAQPPRETLEGSRRLVRGEAAVERVRVPGGCARVRGRGGVELSSEGARAIAPGELETCGPSARTIEVVVVMRGGEGAYAIEVARAP